MSTLALAQSTDVATTAQDVVPGFTGTLTAEQAADLTARIRGALDRVQDALRVAFIGRAHEALGYGSGMAGWEAYYADNFGDLTFAMPTAQRQLEVAKWNDVGGSVRVTATALGVSVGTVSGDRKVVGTPDNVVSLDGRRRDAQAASVTAVEVRAKRVKPLTQRAEEMLTAAGRDGLTSAEAGRRLKAHHGRISATMTRLEQQRRIYRTTDRRDGFSIYVAPDFLVIDAEIVD